MCAMTHASWHDAVAAIRLLTGPSTERQRELARIAGTDLPASLPRIVAAARLQTFFAPELDVSVPGEPSESQLELISVFGDFAPSDVSPAPADAREADAWLKFLWLESRAHTLEALQLEAGDVVERPSRDGELAEVSSIGSDGRIYFRGGLGRGAWPDEVVMRARRSDRTADALATRETSANQRAERARISGWSGPKHAEVREFEVNLQLTHSDIEILRVALESAENERPIQKVVESRPQLLTSLVGGAPRYCIPQVRLGAEYVPDFLVGSVDSTGIRWLLIELETPRSDVTLRDENQLDKHGRKGVSQIETWREWLIQNLDYARRSRRDHGLGLPDIRPGAEGLVIVGRRERLHANSHTVRLPIEESRRIRVHTYDWWLGQLEGIVAYHGPWASNAYLLHPSDEDTAPW